MVGAPRRDWNLQQLARKHQGLAKACHKDEAEACREAAVTNRRRCGGGHTLEEAPEKTAKETSDLEETARLEETSEPEETAPALHGVEGEAILILVLPEDINKKAAKVMEKIPAGGARRA